MRSSTLLWLVVTVAVLLFATTVISCGVALDWVAGALRDPGASP